MFLTSFAQPHMVYNACSKLWVEQIIPKTTTITEILISARVYIKYPRILMVLISVLLMESFCITDELRQF